MAIQIGLGTSTEKNPASAVKEAILLAKKNLYYPADLAIAFGSLDAPSSALLKTVSEYLNEVPLVGATSTAVISDKGILKHGFTVMLLALPKDVHFNIAGAKDIQAKGPRRLGEELGEKLLYGFQGVRRDLGIVFSDGLIQDGAHLIQGLREKLGISFPLVGASVSDNLGPQKSCVYYNQEMLRDGICGLLWGGKLNFGLGIRHGWKALGKPRYVTKSSGNTVYEIDGHSASNVYEEYFDCNLSQLQKDLKHIRLLYPIGIRVAGEEEYLLRNIVSIEDNGSLVFQGDVPEASAIRLMIGTKESLLSAAIQAAEEAKSTVGKNIDFALVFDSFSRYQLLKRDAHKELEIVRHILGPAVPVIGLYTYGEEAPLKAISYQGKVYFHNQTITVLTIAHQEK